MLVCAKSPLATMLLIVSGAPPLFVRVTLCAGLVVPIACRAKFKSEGDTLMAGPVMLPVKLTEWGLPPALSEIVNWADLVPPAEGMKLMLICEL